MVQSIRHWGLASGLLEQKGPRETCVSVFGHFLLELWDPFLEDPASLWLLHWMLASNLGRAGAWYLSFNRYSRPEFTKDQLVRILQDAANHQNVNVSVASLARDIDCLVRMYLPARSSHRAAFEETFDCPLSELAILTSLQDGGFLRFNIGPKPTLPTEIVGFAVLSYWRRLGRDRNAIPFVELLYGEGGPGQLFKLDEDSLLDHTYALGELSSGAVQFDETAGLRQVYFGEAMDADRLLRQYYERKVSP